MNRNDAGGRAEHHGRTVRDAIGAAIGTMLGIVPHVMHHLGVIAGAALISGASGNVLLYAAGMLLSIPMLRRLYRHFHTWWAPAIAAVVFTGLFSVSAFLIGPAISGQSDAPAPPRDGPGPQTPTDEHDHSDGPAH